MTHLCSLPACRAVATVLWQRAATDTETAAEAERQRAARQALVDHQQAALTEAIAACGWSIEQIGLRERDPNLARAAVDRLRAEQADLEARRAALVDVDRPVIDTVVQVVYGCDDHGPAHGGVHDVDCMRHAACECPA